MERDKMSVAAAIIAAVFALGTIAAIAADTTPFTDFHGEAPGKVHHITAADLPKPFATQGVSNNAHIVPRPANAWPQTLPGFKVELFASGLENPRLITTAPNGDLFVAESGPGTILVFRGITPDGKAQTQETFATGLKQPFGIAFYPPGPNPQYIYVGNTDSVVRFPYQNGDLKARGNPETIIPTLPSGGGHTTRNIAFSLDGKQMFIAVGSANNVIDTDTTLVERNRANILVATPDGSDLHVYASGIRNPVGLTIDPNTGEVWTSVNERDMLGDNLPPDYITHVQEGGFYGWPWYYTGGNPDPRMNGKHPELRDKTIVPDVLLEPHNASLELTFYEGKQFPAEYDGDIFAAEHGSWNRSVRTGYEVVLVPIHNGRASGEYEDFVTGFVTPNGDVWGRPVGVAVAPDGSLVVTDDGSNSIWRVSYEKK
ncbi:MAG TPA: sorbosone dehydrogenase family protein [Candidatus Aquilonibacter sp.]|nr:sorbosone dehydrogenase family protein [Candidatus Aquilonibacter sp.]